jgi:hypothetical protein
MMMMMVINEGMFCASRLASESSLGGGICAGGVAGTVAYPRSWVRRWEGFILHGWSWNGIFVAAGFRRFVWGLYICDGGLEIGEAFA